MKRKWAYLGAALPFSMAVSTWATAESTQDDTAKMPRSKSGSWQDEEDERSAATDENPPGKESPGIKAPPRDAYSDEAAREHLDDNFDQMTGLGNTDVRVPVPDSDASMYAPSTVQGSSSFQFTAASGGSITKIVLPNPNGSEGTEEPTGSEVVPTEDPLPVIDQELSDADAMLILLGGMAEGSGDDATSFGEVVFDVVDYGPYTVGYGYASYRASGEEGAFADTSAEVFGADLFFTYEVENSHGGTAYSTTYVLAIDFEGDPSQQTDQGNVNWLELLGQGPFAQNMTSDEEVDVSVNGNYSSLALTSDIGDGFGHPTQVSILTFGNAGSALNAFVLGNQSALSIQAEAHGIDTMTSATASALEIEDQFSSVSGAVTIVA